MGFREANAVSNIEKMLQVHTSVRKTKKCQNCERRSRKTGFPPPEMGFFAGG